MLSHPQDVLNIIYDNFNSFLRFIMLWKQLELNIVAIGLLCTLPIFLSNVGRTVGIKRRAYLDFLECIWFRFIIMLVRFHSFPFLHFIFWYYFAMRQRMQICPRSFPSNIVVLNCQQHCFLITYDNILKPCMWPVMWYCSFKFGFEYSWNIAIGFQWTGSTLFLQYRNFWILL